MRKTIVSALALTMFVSSASIALGEAPRASRSSKPVVAVIPLRAIGLDEAEADILADLFTYGLTQDGRFIVIGRQEAARIIDSLEMPPMDREADGYFYYVGDRLYANAVFSGEVERKNGRYAWKMRVHAPDSQALIGSAEAEADTIEGLHDACPGLIERLLSSMPEAFDLGLGEKFEAALEPFAVRQRILFVFPEGPMNETVARARESLTTLFSAALADDERLPLFVEIAWTIADESSLPAVELAERYDAHRILTLVERDGKVLLKLVGADGKELAAFPADGIADANAAAAAKILDSLVPPLGQSEIALEIEVINATNAKLSGLMREKRILAKRFAASIGQKVVKTVGHPSFHPNLNFISLEANLFWYYSGLLGLGGGYGFSLGYPGTLDSDIAGHPLFIQNEIRFYPLAFRMPGERGIKVDCFLSLNEHNASKITFPAAENVTFTDPTTILFMRAGAEIGYFYTLSETFALSLNAVTLSWCTPLIEGPNFQTDRNFSLDIGGIGIIMRF